MCGDRLANFLSVPTAHSFRRVSVGSRTDAVQSWQSARLASLRRRGVSLQSTHGPPKKHPIAKAVGCFFGGDDGSLNRNVRSKRCKSFCGFYRTFFPPFFSSGVAFRFSSAEWVRLFQVSPPRSRGTVAFATVPLLLVPLTQSGYFPQNSMAGVNPCRDSRRGIRKRHTALTTRL